MQQMCYQGCLRSPLIDSGSGLRWRAGYVRYTPRATRGAGCYGRPGWALGCCYGHSPEDCVVLKLACCLSASPCSSSGAAYLYFRLPASTGTSCHFLLSLWCFCPRWLQEVSPPFCESSYRSLRSQGLALQHPLRIHYRALPGRSLNTTLLR